MTELTKANWEPYFENNHNKLEPPMVLAGGSVSFRHHLGQPLTQDLWEDLIHRLCVTGICIYRPESMQWTLGWGQGHVIINLDSDNMVRDIKFSPHWQFKGK